MNRPGRLVAAALLTVSACAAQADTHVAHVILIEGMVYRPAAVTVKPGDTIVWHNRDLVPHTVTATAQHVESGDIGVGKSWTYRVTKAGTIAYVCRYHPMMHGTIVAGK